MIDSDIKCLESFRVVGRKISKFRLRLAGILGHALLNCPERLLLQILKIILSLSDLRFGDGWHG
jgi:hypothetical protein